VALNLRELWAYRELAYFFVWRDLKVRYKQTVFGVLWAIIQPFMLMVVFSLFLGQISGIAPAGVPYPLFVFAALVPWTLFSTSLIGSSDSLVAASNLIQKVYFPRLLLPVSAIGARLLDFAIAMAVLGLLLLYFGVLPTLTILWVLPLTALAVMTATSDNWCRSWSSYGCSPHRSHTRRQSSLRTGSGSTSSTRWPG
jgi:lipopolysaccharide transport system permease protein